MIFYIIVPNNVDIVVAGTEYISVGHECEKTKHVLLG